MANSHQLKKIRTVRHKHPRRTRVLTEIDYGDIVEITELTTSEKPIETIQDKTKEKNPNKVHVCWIGAIEVFFYKNATDNFFLSFNGTLLRYPKENWRRFAVASFKLQNYLDNPAKKKPKKRSKK